MKILKIKRLMSFLMLLLMSQYTFANACALNLTALNFGTYNPVSKTDTNMSGDVNIFCDSSINITVKMSRGNSNNFNQRYLKKFLSSEQLNYNLYLDSARTQIWGDGTQATQYLIKNIIFRGLAYQSIPIYGKLPQLQAVSNGSYYDFPLIEIDF